jgi:hypothetical protein
MPKDEIVRRGLIYGQIPMYAVMGSIGLAGQPEGDNDYLPAGIPRITVNR